MSDSVLFTGSSRYANDFQSVIDRTVKIASLPMQIVRNSKDTLDRQSAATKSLADKVAAVSTAVGTLKDTLGGLLLKATVSNTAAAKATVSDGAVEGTYNLAIKSLGSYASSLSKASGVAKVINPASDSITAQTSLTLTLTGIDDPTASQSFTVNTRGGASLTALADAINTKTEGKITATVVNVGTSSDKPDYRLSLQSSNLGESTITLNDGVQELMSAGAAGELAKYTLAGGTTEFTSTSRALNVAPGVVLELTGKNADGDSTTVTVKRDTTALSNALSSVATAYNTVMDEIGKHRGGTGGPLAGDAVLNTVAASLHSIVTYATGSRGIASLTALGLEFDANGKLSVNSETLTKATDSKTDMEQVTALLGSATTGFVKYAVSILDGLTKESKGVLSAHINSINEESKRADEQIAASQDRVDRMEEDLRERLSAADAVIAALEQQAKYMIGMFEQMRVNSQS